MKTLVLSILILTLIMAAIFYYISSYEIATNTTLETTSSTTTVQITTTTTQVTTTTTQITTTTQAITNFSVANISADDVTNEAIAWLEKRTFELVNEERMMHGLDELKWNEEVAQVCRAHSKDMAEAGFFSHTGSDGSNVSVRLKGAEIYYWNLIAENILMESGIDYYAMNLLGMIKKVEYKTFEELAQEAVDGWMNSTGHMKNILEGGFDESAIGVYVLQTMLSGSSYLNVSYYFTQDFITRIECGYKGGPCCETVGYLPWCYVPWKCVAGVCE